jgi:hypothetical protein
VQFHHLKWLCPGLFTVSGDQPLHCAVKPRRGLS